MRGAEALLRTLVAGGVDVCFTNPGTSEMQFVAALDRVARAALKALVWLYRLTLGPLLGPRCRFLPTCSDYALEALERHGPWRGSVLTAKRLFRCHPWGGEGYDPVPDDCAAACCHHPLKPETR